MTSLCGTSALAFSAALSLNTASSLERILCRLALASLHAGLPSDMKQFRVSCKKRQSERHAHKPVWPSWPEGILLSGSSTLVHWIARPPGSGPVHSLQWQHQCDVLATSVGHKHDELQSHSTKQILVSLSNAKLVVSRLYVSRDSTGQSKRLHMNSPII